MANAGNNALFRFTYERDRRTVILYDGAKLARMCLVNITLVLDILAIIEYNIDYYLGNEYDLTHGLGLCEVCRAFCGGNIHIACDHHKHVALTVLRCFQKR